MMNNDELIEIGIEAYEAKDYAKALEAFVQITPDFEQHDIVRGEIICFHYNLGHYEEAIRLAALETEENSSYSAIVANKMWAHFRLGQYDEVIRFYRASTLKLDEDAREHYLKAVQNAAMRAGDNALADEIAKKLGNMYFIEKDDNSTVYVAT